MKKLDKRPDERYPAKAGASYVVFIFNGVTESGKTAEYNVETDTGKNEVLGTIGWFGRWRCYSFDPWPGTTFEKTCLRDIADFCERLTREHNERVRARRRGAK